MSERRDAGKGQGGTDPRRGPVRWLHRLGIEGPGPEESADWEVEHHIAELADRLVAEEGLEPEAARAEAERRFGDPGRYRASMRRMDARRMKMMRRSARWEIVREAVASSVRTARRYPGFTLGIIVTLALGIGANATMYGIVDRLLLQPPAHVQNADRVVRIFEQRPSFLREDELITSSGLTFPDYEDLKAHRGFEQVAALGYPQDMTVGSGQGAQRVDVVQATHELFPLLGVQPRLGRFYGPDDDRVGATLTAVISSEYWKRAYGEDPGVLGSTLELSGRPATIIGVAPPDFTGVDLAPVDVWLPLVTSDHITGGDECRASRGCWWIKAVARLRPELTLASAEEEATRLHRNGRREMIDQGRFPAEAAIVLGPLIAAQGPEASPESRVARWLAIVSLIVLLVACANVANLFLTRSMRQRREVAVRLALGVSRRRLVGQRVVEALLLSLVGGVVAVVLARWGGEVLRRTLLPGVLFPGGALNTRVLGVTMILSLAAGLLAGLGPAIQSTRADVANELGEGGRGSSTRGSRLRSGLIVAQAAMSVVLLVGAGLFVKSLDHIHGLDLGLDVDRLVLAGLEFNSSDLEPAERNRAYGDAVQALAGLPQVESAAVTTAPLGWGMATGLSIPGVDSIPTLPGGGPYFYGVTPGYLSTVGLKTLRGRAFDASDGANSEKVVVVSETMADVLWPDADALGACMVVGQNDETCRTVVGVVEDAARSGYRDRPYMAYYLPLAQVPEQQGAGLYIRVRSAPGDAVGDIARTLRSFSPLVRYASVQTLRDRLDPQARSWTLGATMFSLFGLLALVVAAVGLYSVLAVDVARRTRELGIRAALGARRVRLLRSVLIEGTRLAVFGVVLGLLIAWIAAPRASDLLFEVDPHDAGTLAVVTLALVAVAVAASLIPGMRATRVDPSEALRAE